ncbi:MAG: MCE family protein [Bacteroidetes bacterium]|nr:MCE family protein [Bacteroidota bacterium]
MKISKEVKIGLIVTAGIALLWWGVNYLKGKDLFTRQKQVFAVYSQVEGLAASNPVMINGMKVGLIHSLTLRPEDGKIVVSLHVTNKVRVPKIQQPEIFSTDLLGSKEFD